jgi:elongator complex protein 1
MYSIRPRWALFLSVKISNQVDQIMNSFEFDTELPVFEDVTTAKLEDQIVYIGLKESKLYANDRLLCNTCSSFFVSHDFLMITTLEHTLRFLALNVDYDEFEFKEDSADFIGYNERIRRIENGAKILTQYDQSLVLIMPRGNLETIYPRALVLGHISKKIHG